MLSSQVLQSLKLGRIVPAPGLFFRVPLFQPCNLHGHGQRLAEQTEIYIGRTGCDFQPSGFAEFIAEDQPMPHARIHAAVKVAFARNLKLAIFPRGFAMRRRAR